MRYDFDVRKVAKEMFQSVPTESKEVLRIRVILIDKPCRENTHTARLEQSAYLLDSPIRRVQMFEHLGGNDGIE